MPAARLTTDLYFTTSTVVDWMDVFTRPVYKHVIVQSLTHCQEQKGLDVYAWVLMTNHLHMIVGTREDGISIGDIMRDFKKYTSKSILKAIQENMQESRKEWMLNRFGFRAANDRKITNFKFWKDGNHVETISSYDFYRQKLDYIHMNPVRQEIVQRPEEYLYSSARDYCGEKGLLNVLVQP